ncbi:hypothetical protein CAOG_05709 [Capsaspora owczarzaki ATCC 30864]|uniref:Uncharacterized protein n=1 Tax=Capsaspora owczarzaki (strain ATCC 30864) TaxID=595528 RepID=A0A0D2WTZ1_CAPO3|nr:hypothetical protein CAOG_05709 [Capsaspora owczarzaki ATCC 30864]KJE95233.1 hypothetical protein CAOG_005709 [Capsaspora owczarzaki ATCC 30864]|eukprot:XP_004346382.1 hypothetical protein CAOG_05709 [Capsaspora owczarzaki ATCC 30864]
MSESTPTKEIYQNLSLALLLATNVLAKLFVSTWDAQCKAAPSAGAAPGGGGGGSGGAAECDGATVLSSSATTGPGVAGLPPLSKAKSKGKGKGKDKGKSKSKSKDDRTAGAAGLSTGSHTMSDSAATPAASTSASTSAAAPATMTAWTHDTRSGAALLAKLPPKICEKQRPEIAKGKPETWDITVLGSIILNVLPLSEIDRSAVREIVKYRNDFAHATASEITPLEYARIRDGLRAALVDKLATDAAEFDACFIETLHRVSAPAPDAVAAAEREKAAGNELFKQKAFDEAIKCYTAALLRVEHYPSELTAVLLTNRATAHLKLAHFVEAKHDAKRALLQGTPAFKAHLRLAEAYLKCGKHTKACRHAECAYSGFQPGTAEKRLARELLDKCRLERATIERGEDQNSAYSMAFQNAAESPFRQRDVARVGGQANFDALLRLATSLGTSTAESSASPSSFVTEFQLNIQAHNLRDDGKFAQAYPVFLRLAQLGNAIGMYNVGLFLMKGLGVAQDIAQATAWFERATQVPIRDDELFKDQRIAIGAAFVSLGNNHFNGIGCSKNLRLALPYYQRAAALEAPTGYNMLGLYHWSGLDESPVDRALARDYFRLAAEGGCTESMTNMSLLLRDLGLLDRAAQWADTAQAFGVHKAAALASSIRSTIQRVGPTNLQHVQEFCNMMPRLRAPPTLLPFNQYPTLDELEAIASPTVYLSSLISAKRQLIAAIDEFRRNPVTADSTRRLISRAASARRTVDGGLVCDPESAAVLRVILEQSHPDETLEHDRRTLLSGTEVEYAISAANQYCEDSFLNLRTGCQLMFDSSDKDKEKGLFYLRRAFQIVANRSENDLERLDVTYSLGTAYRICDKPEQARKLFMQFLEHKHLGHREVCEAYFQLGLLSLLSLESVERNCREAKKFLDLGIAAQRTLPGFLQPRHKPLNRALLEDLLTMFAKGHLAARVIPVPQEGGHVLSGPRAPEALMPRGLSSKVLEVYRSSRVKFLKEAPKISSMFKLAPPSKHITSAETLPLSPIQIDEMFLPCVERLYHNRVLECVIVGSGLRVISISYIVEDSSRAPAILSIYNLSAAQERLLVPGRVIKIISPLARVPQSGPICIRVDDPQHRLFIGDHIPLCWFCLKQQEASLLMTCGRCKQANNMATTTDPELRSRRVNYWRMKSVFTFAELVLQRLFVATWNRASETDDRN